MCGVVGAIIIKPTEADLKQVVDVMLNMQIRGQHATGVSWVKDDIVHTKKEPVPGTEFWKGLDPKTLLNEDGNLYMIGHVRYSTSDLRYNQPIGEGELAIAHNGVITQEPPETWEKTFGYKCETSNDSELIYQHAVQGTDTAFEKFPDSSMAVTWVGKAKFVGAFRNHARPLATVNIVNGVVFASTVDALERSGLTGGNMVPQYVNFVCQVEDDKILTVCHPRKELHKDLQEM
ncbi:MAG: class II glutamine amidotransferase [Cyclobacteriaceae bacterium]